MTLAELPNPPYYAVIFTARRTEGDRGYQKMAKHMEALARTMPGYLGFESARNEDGLSIAVSYWESQEAIANWKRHSKHREAQARGRDTWYSAYRVQIAEIERSYTHINSVISKEN